MGSEARRVRRLFEARWVMALLAVVAFAANAPAAQAQGTVCDTPCKLILLPLITPKDQPVPTSNPFERRLGVGVCDSPCKFILLPLVTPGSTMHQAKLPFVVTKVTAADMPLTPTQLRAELRKLLLNPAYPWIPR